MLGLALLVVSIGLVDSLNPSTIVPALYLASGAAPARRTLEFALGVSGVNLLGGIALLGPGRLLLRAVPDPGAHTVHLLELGLGVCALIAAALAWITRTRLRDWSARSGGAGNRGALISGALIAGVELPTAVPYFAAIAAVAEAHVSVASAIALLVLFNLAFMVPVFAIAVLGRLAGGRVASRADEIRARVLRHLGGAVAGLLLLAGAVLLAVAAVGLLA
jgi:cytochrome c biogenesis protein CcdA